jgi:hypothetical protein
VVREWAAAFGPLRNLKDRNATFWRAPSRGQVRGGAPVRRSFACGSDCAAVLGFRSRCETRFTHCVRCAQTVAASQSTKRAGTRADRNPVLLAAAQARHRAPAHGLARDGVFFGGRRARAGHRARPSPCGAPAARGKLRARCPRLATHPPPRTIVSRKAAGGLRAQRIGAAEHRRLWVGARTHALREHTHRVCSSATSAASEVSYAVRPDAEEHRAPVAQQRASLCAAHEARPSPCLHRPQRKRIADTGQQPIRANNGPAVK